MLDLVSNTFLLGKIELFLKHFRILPQKFPCCRPTVLPLCVPLAAIVDQNDFSLWYSQEISKTLENQMCHLSKMMKPKFQRIQEKLSKAACH